MPPSATTHQIVGETDRLNQIPHVKFDHESPIIKDIPTENGLVVIKTVESRLNDITRGGATCLASVNGTDPSVGNATIVQQAADRAQSARITLLSMMVPGGNIHNICSGPAFTTGKHIMDYIRAPGVIYLAPNDDVAEDHKTKTKALTYLDLPVEEQNESLCLHFKAMLQSHNPKLHTNFDIPEADLIATYCNGLHPEAKLEANKCRKNNTYARAEGVCYSATYPAHHPLTGTAHPHANTISLDLLAVHVHNYFNERLTAGTFRLKGKPTAGAGLNVVDPPSAEPDTAMDDTALPDTGPDRSGFIYMSLNLIGARSFYEYALNVFNRDNARMRTCRNCGGVNHFSHRDGVLICPSPEGSVPTNLLRNIQYPFGVSPWRFGAGKGKGKGKGKGGGRGRGGGRGGYWMHYRDDDTWVWATDEPNPSDDAGQSVDYIIDDYDGFND